MYANLNSDILIVGGRGGSNVGESFERASHDLALKYSFLDTNEAMAGLGLFRRISWHLLNRRPPSLGNFSRVVVNECRRVKPRLLLTTGLSPVNSAALHQLGQMGIVRCNFQTDDPWNPAHRSPWFLRALQHYDVIFTPRKLVRPDLQRHTCARVVDLKFGVDPELFHPVSVDPQELEKLECDVLFAGGADGDRIPYLSALRKSGLQVGLYGSYWEQFEESRPITRGQIGVQTLTKVISAAKISLCLVRQANRDQHCMRTFEVPAVGCCMLTQDTEDHREIFGREGESVLFFQTISEMLDKAKWLLNNDGERLRLARSCHARIVDGAHTYRDRLQTILNETL